MAAPVVDGRDHDSDRAFWACGGGPDRGGAGGDGARPGGGGASAGPGHAAVGGGSGADPGQAGLAVLKAVSVAQENVGRG